MATDPSRFDDILKRFDELTPEEREQLIDELEQRRTTNSTEQPTRSLLDAFNARGLIGSIKDTPPDWSTNPKYMEGFGRDCRTRTN